MDKNPANPLLVTLLFMARCLVPLLLMLGVSYLLRKLGLVAPPEPPPPDYDESNDNENGGLLHGKA